jgi:hypothetical protein
VTDQVTDWQQHYLDDIRAAFLAQKNSAERAIAQLGDDIWGDAGNAGNAGDAGDAGDVGDVGDGGDGGDGEDNSVAVLMKHVGGNLHSRWTRPFETDGEKADRDRDGEFVVEGDTVDSIREAWDRGWQVLDEALTSLRPSDMPRPVRIRGERLSLVQALHRSLAHTAQHVGQIILLAKQRRGADWETLSIPRGESARYLQRPPA